MILPKENCLHCLQAAYFNTVENKLSPEHFHYKLLEYLKEECSDIHDILLLEKNGEYIVFYENVDGKRANHRFKVTELTQNLIPKDDK
jgi:hypothetical protein